MPKTNRTDQGVHQGTRTRNRRAAAADEATTTTTLSTATDPVPFSYIFTGEASSDTNPDYGSSRAVTTTTQRTLFWTTAPIDEAESASLTSDSHSSAAASPTNSDNSAISKPSLCGPTPDTILCIVLKQRSLSNPDWCYRGSRRRTCTYISHWYRYWYDHGFLLLHRSIWSSNL